MTTGRNHCRQQGPKITISGDGADLVVEGPESVLTTEFLEELVARKSAILRLLSLKQNRRDSPEYVSYLSRDDVSPEKKDENVVQDVVVETKK